MKLAIIFDANMKLLARRRTLAAALTFVSEYGKPCHVRTPEGTLLHLNQSQGH